MPNEALPAQCDGSEGVEKTDGERGEESGGALQQTSKQTEIEKQDILLQNHQLPEERTASDTMEEKEGQEGKEEEENETFPTSAFTEDQGEMSPPPQPQDDKNGSQASLPCV
eukprot:755029-Hanusia_phi.AAC.25